MGMTRCLARALVLVVVVSLPSMASARRDRVDTLMELAVSSDTTVSDPAIRELRARGPAAFARMLDRFASDIETHLESLTPDSKWARVSRALDLVGGQRDCASSRLYWYTDLDAARADAETTGRPILSLRLLGRLDQELSCANSRFFRTALYSNAEISAYLREHYVLHWSSERPAPTITIDFGDGRTLVRTITGNSIHYVLDPQGRIVDAIPGLYGPGAFIAELRRAEAQAERVAGLPDSEWKAAETSYLSAWLAINANAFRSAVSALNLPATADASESRTEDTRMPPREPNQHPTAAAASSLAITKSLVEVPMLEAMGTEMDPRGYAWSDPVWSRLSGRAAATSRLDGASIAAVRRHLAHGASLDRVVSSFQRAMALDTVRNEFLIRPRIIRHLVVSGLGERLEDVNDWVYAAAFETPKDDPWIGLMQLDTYTGLERGGVADDRTHASE